MHSNKCDSSMNRLRLTTWQHCAHTVTSVLDRKRLDSRHDPELEEFRGPSLALNQVLLGAFHSSACPSSLLLNSGFLRLSVETVLSLPLSTPWVLARGGMLVAGFQVRVFLWYAIWLDSPGSRNAYRLPVRGKCLRLSDLPCPLTGVCTDSWWRFRPFENRPCYHFCSIPAFRSQCFWGDWVTWMNALFFSKMSTCVTSSPKTN